MKKVFAKLTVILIVAALVISAVPFAVSAKTTDIFVSAESMDEVLAVALTAAEHPARKERLAALLPTAPERPGVRL